MSDLRLRTLGLKDIRLRDFRLQMSDVSHPSPEVSQSIVSLLPCLPPDVLPLISPSVSRSLKVYRLPVSQSDL